METFHTRNLARLRALWQLSQGGSPQALVLSGTAGMGKSWFLQQWRSSLSLGQAQQVWGVQGPFLRGLLQAGQQWFKEMRNPAFVSAARQVWPEAAWPTVLGATHFDSADHLALAVFGAVQELAVRLGSLTVMVEDATGFGPDDLKALELFWRKAQASQAPLLFVLAARPELAETIGNTLQRNTPNPSRLNRWALGPLDLTGTQSLIQEVLQSPYLSEDLAPWLHSRSEGHPLHSVELLRVLIDGGALRNLGPTWTFNAAAASSLPKSLEAVLRQRLVQIEQDSELYHAVITLAIGEQPLALSDLAKLHQQPAAALRETLDQGKTAGIVQQNPQGQYSLSHPLYPPLVRSKLSSKQRQQLHAQYAALALEPDTRAHHARLGKHLQAVEWTRQALGLAMERFAWDKAIQHAQALLELGQATPADRLALGQALIEAGRAQEAEATLSELSDPAACLLRVRALRQTGQAAQALACLQGLSAPSTDAVLLEAGLQVELGQLEAGQSLLEQLLQTELSPTQRATALGELGRIAFNDNDFKRALAHNTEAAGLLSPAQPALLSLCLNRVGMLATHLGHWEQAETALLESIRLQEGLASLAFMAARYNNLGLLYNSQGQYSQSRPVLLKALRLAEAAGERSTLADTVHNLAVLEFNLGHYATASQHYSRYIELMRSLGRKDRTLEAEFYAAERQARLGDLAPALKAMQELPMISDCAVVAARVWVMAGQPQKALQVLEEPLALNHGGAFAFFQVKAAAQLKLGQSPQDALRAAQHLLGLKTNPYQSAELQLLEAVYELQNGQTEAALKRAAAAKAALGTGPGHLRFFEQAFVSEAAQLLADGPAQAVHTAQRFIRTLGQFELEQDGRILPWKARKPRELLALLLAAYLREDGPGAAREGLVAELWPETEPEKAESSFRVTLGRLREALGESIRIEHHNGRYSLVEPKADVLLFVQAAERLDLEGAVSWYTGAFLPGVDLPALDPLRAKLHERWRKAIFQLSSELSPAQLIPLFDRLVAEDPFDLEAIQALGRLLNQTAQETKLRQLMQQSRQRFSQELGHVPKELLAL